MKILLNALPRTGSKWLAVNLSKYLDTAFGRSAYLYIDNKPWVISDWFDYQGDQLLFHGKICQINHNFILTNETVDIEQEMYSRLDLLVRYDAPIQIKVHPQTLPSLIACEILKKQAYRYYSLRRRDTFEQVFSKCLCIQTEIWNPGVELNVLLIDLLKNPIEISEEQFLFELRQNSTQIDYLDNELGCQHLYFEDLVNIKNSGDFCSWLNLPVVEFRLDQYFTKEYGPLKPYIVKNYQKLKEIYESWCLG
jgi:hypothetical protein